MIVCNFVVEAVGLQFHFPEDSGEKMPAPEHRANVGAMTCIAKVAFRCKYIYPF